MGVVMLRIISRFGRLRPKGRGKAEGRRAEGA
jgi:hypothetical protein